MCYRLLLGEILFIILCRLWWWSCKESGDLSLVIVTLPGYDDGWIDYGDDLGIYHGEDLYRD